MEYDDKAPLLLINNSSLCQDSDGEETPGREKCENVAVPLIGTPPCNPKISHQNQLTEKDKGKRSLMERLRLSKMFSTRSSSDTSTMTGEETKHRASNSFSFPWIHCKALKKAQVLFGKDSCMRPGKVRHGHKNLPGSPALLTSPKYSGRKKHRLWWSESKGRNKTVPAEIQPNSTNTSCQQPRSAWKVCSSSQQYGRWPTAVQGMHCVALVLLVTLLSPVGAFCPRGCSCDDVGLRVHCVNVELDVIPILLNPKTLEINLSHNRIKTILEGLSFYHKLQYLDLSHNEVVSFGSQNFASQTVLNTLVVNNNKVSRIQSRAFLGLLGLINLDLSDNYIETIENDAFSSLGRLNTLDLSNNRIMNLSFNTFNKLQNLRELNLCKNALKHISHIMFESLKQLQDLDLCSNQIETIHDYTFVSQKALINLKLSNNKVKYIQNKAFDELSSLRFLDLKGNMLTQVPSQVFLAIRGLEELDIGINPLSILLFDSFVHLVNLKSLHVSRCDNLSFIDSNTFSNLSTLTSLELSFNPQLTVLHPKLFQPLLGLRSLVLRGNDLRAFDHSLVSSISLDYLDLRDNNLECNCSLKWLQEAAMNTTISMKIEEISCVGPEVLRGRNLSELSEYELQCYNNLVVLASCAAVSMVVLLLLIGSGILYYKNCRKMKAIVQDNWPEKIVATWKDPEYQKQVEEEEYTFHSLRGVQHIPVTVICQELGGGEQPQLSGLHDELIERTKALKASFSTRENSKGRTAKRHTNRRIAKDDYICNGKTFRDDSFSFDGRTAKNAYFSSLRMPPKVNQDGYFGVYPVNSQARCATSGHGSSRNGGQRISYYLPPTPPLAAPTNTTPRRHGQPIYAEPRLDRL